MKRKNKKAQTEDIFADFGISFIIIIIGIYILSLVGGTVKTVEQKEEAVQNYLYRDTLDVATYLQTETKVGTHKISFADLVSRSYYNPDDLKEQSYFFISELSSELHQSNINRLETGAFCYKITVKYPTQEDLEYKDERGKCMDSSSQYVSHIEKDRTIIPLYNYKTAEVILSAGSTFMNPPA